MRFVALALVLLTATPARAWGERGHDVVTRVAARLVAARMIDDPSLSTPLVQREHMLAHLANVPDIVWRSGDRASAKANGPTHYINWEKLLPTPTLNDAPRAYAKAVELAKERGVDLPGEVGTAPWRVEQLATAMTAALVKVKQQGASEERVNDALLYAGLLSHFVGDLAQPYHNTNDHDGASTGQGGIHAYFESDLVSAAPLQLEADVFAAALANEPAKKLTGGSDPLAIAIAESFDALGQLDDVRRLDREHAVITKGDAKKPAKRKPASVALPYFQGRITERLAMGADVLATLWMNAWVAAGKPDMRGYKSYVYPTHPEFVAPSYIVP